MATAPFPITPELMAISIAYKNVKYIADDVLPRVPTGTQEFKYTVYTKAESFTVPDTKVGRKSAPNEVEFTGTETTSKCQDYALDDPVPQEDVINAEAVNAMTGGHYDPLGRATEGTTDLVMLDREVRVANLVFVAANYPTGNKSTLSGTSQWSDYANSDPVAAIQAAMDAMIFRPNCMTIGRPVFTKLISHPKIVQAVFGTAQTSGIVKREQLAALFELDNIFVGDAWVNTAKRGQTLTLGRVWGKHCVLHYRDLRADTRGGTTFGYTAQWGARIAGAQPDSKIGMRGGQRVRVGESVKELITASDLGYMFESAVA